MERKPGNPLSYEGLRRLTPPVLTAALLSSLVIAGSKWVPGDEQAIKQAPHPVTRINYGQGPSETLISGHSGTDQKDQINRPDLVKANFVKTLDWMDQSNYPQVRQVASLYRGLASELDQPQSEKLRVIKDGISSQVAFDVILMDTDDPEIYLVVMTFSEPILGARGYNPENGAYSLFKLHLKLIFIGRDPQKYLTNPIEVDQEATRLANPIFKVVGPS